MVISGEMQKQVTCVKLIIAMYYNVAARTYFTMQK